MLHKKAGGSSSENQTNQGEESVILMKDTSTKDRKTVKGLRKPSTAELVFYAG